MFGFQDSDWFSSAASTSGDGGTIVDGRTSNAGGGASVGTAADLGAGGIDSGAAVSLSTIFEGCRAPPVRRPSAAPLPTPSSPPKKRIHGSSDVPSVRCPAASDVRPGRMPNRATLPTSVLTPPAGPVRAAGTNSAAVPTYLPGL